MNTTIADCLVDGVGHLFHNQPGAIRVKGDPSGTVLVEHNWVRDSSYAGVMVSWQDGEAKPAAPFPWRFVVRGNLVEDIGNGILSDFGGIWNGPSGFATGSTLVVAAAVAKIIQVALSVGARRCRLGASTGPCDGLSDESPTAGGEYEVHVQVGSIINIAALTRLP